jgi:TrmH family RNA methyltransferase
LLRTALSFGFDAAYFLPGCVDPFNEKVIRAAKGALFHLPLLYGDWQQLLSLKNTFSLEFYQAAMDGIPMTDCRISLPFALILGNESHGTSKESRAYSQGISIPMSGKTDSLNVAIAGGILMFNVSGLCQK